MSKPRPAWTEYKVGRMLARNMFKNAILVMDNCTWPGSECDLLVVRPCLRIIEVEIKISRADLKADAKKEKWWHRPPIRFVDGQWTRDERNPIGWPRGIWKHYYAMPAEIWSPDLTPIIQPNSGIVLVYDHYTACTRRAKPNSSVAKLNSEQMHHLARLANVRMWEAYERADEMRERLESERKASAA